jgi:dTDP-4-amino-4,6-dideoxygalactose transaminase
MEKKISRRRFMETTLIGATSVVGAASIPAFGFYTPQTDKLAMLDGQPVRKKPFHAWPVWDQADEDAILPVLRSGVWSRQDVVREAEEKFARLMGAKHCLLTTNGTNALTASLYALGVGGGDEVITTPFTFVATVDAILLNNALPVFADIDPETWQIDPDKIEERITENTVAILPAHITCGMSNMEKINTIAQKHNLRVVEDACQAHLAEWNHKKAGTLGDLGCLSLQNSKNITCGEGGAILGDDEQLMDLCYSYHNFGRPQGRYMSRDRGGHPILGTKCRMAEYQASIVITQMDSVEEETKRRTENAAYLTEKMKEIPGIVPVKHYGEMTRTTFYYYGLRYKKQHYNDCPRDLFIKALRAEGIPVSTGLGVIEGKSIHKEGLIEETLNSKTFQKIYSKERLDSYRGQLDCPESDQLVEETIGFHSRILLGSRQDMDDIYRAFLKIYENRTQLS